MQLSRFEIKGLFGRYHHVINFPRPGPEDSSPSIVILHGANGIGKTTILRMLNGILDMDFDVFRQTPFVSCSLSFDAGPSISVKRTRRGNDRPLRVTYGKSVVLLNPDVSGPYRGFSRQVAQYKKRFGAARSGLTFDLIEATRFSSRERADADEEDQDEVYLRVARRTPKNPKSFSSQSTGTLAAKVAQFVQEAQVNYRRFFSTTEPDLFSKIIQTLTARAASKQDAKNLRERLLRIRSEDKTHERYGLEPDHWDYKKLVSFLTSDGQSKSTAHALTVLGAYVEVLETRAAERALVAERLRTFECLMSEFMLDKVIRVEPKSGLNITTTNGKTLRENQLSSGEYHLLYLMTSALVTRKRGTVIAIDEPEMSMHLAWQRRLVKALFQCASKATPQFIFATHSPDIAADFPDALVELAP